MSNTWCGKAAPVPSNVIYWFASKVLNLAPDIAIQTTEFLKTRTQLEPTPERRSASDIEGVSGGVLVDPSDVERRLEKLEVEYQLLQEQHRESLRLLTYKSDNMGIFRAPVPPTSPQSPVLHSQASTELVKVDTSFSGSPQATTGDMETQETQALLQEIGLRLGKVVLEWAGDTMKQTVLSVANARSTSNPKAGDTGMNLAGRLASAIMT
ncbi:hypothetical protein VSDG_08872 [Cytospora chrysosperma]|uniref:Uncharacterized protein n=1 Tax=Cytospora chrysosperma TaxID=252740 RepID=A0A423VDT2_CYTCH|nr:hypothetical protein VSDG_08872 [Valsa sordida]